MRYLSEKEKKWDLSHQLLDVIEEISKILADRNVKVENALKQDNKEKFIEAPLGVTNFSYFLAETMYAKTLEPRDLLVIDECHNLIDAATDINSKRITPYSMRLCLRDLENIWKIKINFMVVQV